MVCSLLKLGVFHSSTEGAEKQTRLQRPCCRVRPLAESASRWRGGKRLSKHIPRNPTGARTLKKGTTVRNCTVRLYADCRTSKPSMSLAAVIFWSLPGASDALCYIPGPGSKEGLHTRRPGSVAPSFIMSSALLYDSVSEASMSFTHTPARNQLHTVTERPNSMATGNSSVITHQ